MNPSEDKQSEENRRALRLTCDELAAQFETGGAPAQITMIDSLLIATALRQYALSANAEHDPWKEAIIDGLIVNHIYSKADEEDPRKALNKLLAWEQSVALDQKVSSDAEALIEQGRRSALSSTTTSEAASLAEQWKGRADDCGRLARAVLDATRSATAPSGSDNSPRSDK